MAATASPLPSRQAPKVDTNPVEALLKRAELLVETGRYRDALLLVKRARAADPENSRACCLDACIHLNLEEPKKAAVAARAAICKEPEYEWAHQLLATALLRLGDPTGACRSAETALRIAPDAPETLRVAHRCFLRAGRKREARSLAERLLRVAPERSDTHVALGEMVAAESKWKEAEPHFRRALRLNATNTHALNWLGYVLEHQGKRREAVECFHRSARLDPSGDWIRGSLIRVISDYSGVGVAGLVVGAIYSIFSHTGGWSPGAWALALLSSGLLILGAVWWHRRRIAALHPEVARFYREELRRSCEPFLRLPLLVKLLCLGLPVLLLWTVYRSRTGATGPEVTGWESPLSPAPVIVSVAVLFLAIWWVERSRQRSRGGR